MCECQRCHKKFDFQYLLDKHLARKFPCKERDGQNEHKDGQNEHKDGQNEHSRCVYCLKVYSSVSERNRHITKCKLKEDHVRCLELKLEITPESIPKNKCRFCLKDFFNSSSLSRHDITCKAKEEYKEKLEKQLEDRKPVAATTINNTTNNNTNSHNTNTTNNTINNNITVRAFGKENMDYITREVILKLCRKANFRNEIIPRLVKQVHFNPEHPENHNVLMTNLRAAYGKIYDGEDYVVETSKDIVDKVMDNVTDHLTTAAYMDNEDGKFNPYERAITRLEEDMGDEDSKFKREQRTNVKRSSASFAKGEAFCVKRNMYNSQRLVDKIKKMIEC